MEEADHPEDQDHKACSEEDTSPQEAHAAVEARMDHREEEVAHAGDGAVVGKDRADDGAMIRGNSNWMILASQTSDVPQHEGMHRDHKGQVEVLLRSQEEARSLVAREDEADLQDPVDQEVRSTCTECDQKVAARKEAGLVAPVDHRTQPCSAGAWA